MLKNNCYHKCNKIFLLVDLSLLTLEILYAFTGKTILFLHCYLKDVKITLFHYSVFVKNTQVNSSMNFCFLRENFNYKNLLTFICLPESFPCPKMFDSYHLN